MAFGTLTSKDAEICLLEWSTPVVSLRQSVSAAFFSGATFYGEMPLHGQRYRVKINRLTYPSHYCRPFSTSEKKIRHIGRQVGSWNLDWSSNLVRHRNRSVALLIGWLTWQGTFRGSASILNLRNTSHERRSHVVVDESALSQRVTIEFVDCSVLSAKCYSAAR